MPRELDFWYCHRNLDKVGPCGFENVPQSVPPCLSPKHRLQLPEWLQIMGQCGFIIIINSALINIIHKSLQMYVVNDGEKNQLMTDNLMVSVEKKSMI